MINVTALIIVAIVAFIFGAYFMLSAFIVGRFYFEKLKDNNFVPSKNYLYPIVRVCGVMTQVLTYFAIAFFITFGFALAFIAAKKLGL